MKTTGVILIIVGLFIALPVIGTCINGEYHCRNEYLNHWTLADRSSTITAKQQHIRDFVDALEKGNSNGRFAAYDAIFLQTPSNNFRTNMTALETLNQRLSEIQNMDPNSFQYNTAIQQITAQEQGEAHEMLGVLSGCFFLANYPIAWSWIEIILLSISISLGFFGIVIFFVGIDD